MEEITEIQTKVYMVRGLRAAMDIILPRTCAVCGRTLNLDERHLCLPCLAELPLTYFWERDHNTMADKFNDKMEEGMNLRSEDGKNERYAYAASLFFYDGQGNYRHIPHRLKYQGDIMIGRYFAGMLGRKLGQAGHFMDVDLVIPVPLHWTRRWKRGYNQAEVIAEEIARELGAPLRTDILRRRRRTRTQTKVGPGEKSANVRGAFNARLPVDRKMGNAGSDDAAEPCMGAAEVRLDAPEVRLDAAYRHILLVDDVFTSGSTLFACFTALRAVFPPSVRISVATLGFVGGA